MKNVLIFKFPYSSLFGGGERHMLLLVEGLIKKDFNFYLVSSCPVLLKEFKARHWPARKAWAGVEPVAKWSLVLFPFTALFVFLRLCLVLFYYRFWKKVTVLYCLSLTEKILATWPARILGMRVFWVEHVTVERWLTKNPLKIFYRLFSFLAKVITISKVIRDQLVEMIGVREKRITVIYNGVDLRKFEMKEYRWEKAARYNIGCVARLEKEKGIEFLIQAIKIIREFIPFVRLIIVGEGKERKKLIWLSERLGLQEIIQWIGHQKEIEKWYTYFDALALPSVVRESFGITLVEAMAIGIPVVASDIGGTGEIIDNKVTGLLARPGDSQDLADQLIYLYNNRTEAREMVLKAREKVEEQFNLERMIRDFYLLLRK